MILISTYSVQGNQILHEITVHRLYELRVNLEDFAGNKRFAKYSHFRIGNEADGYRLTLSGYTGNAGKSKFTPPLQRYYLITLMYIFAIKIVLLNEQYDIKYISKVGIHIFTCRLTMK